jgi:hypothetical protein
MTYYQSPDFIEVNGTEYVDADSAMDYVSESYELDDVVGYYINNRLVTIKDLKNIILNIQKLIASDSGLDTGD